MIDIASDLRATVRTLLFAEEGSSVHGLHGNLPELSTSVCVKSVARSGGEGGRHWTEPSHREAW